MEETENKPKDTRKERSIVFSVKLLESDRDKLGMIKNNQNLDSDAAALRKLIRDYKL